MDLKDFIKETLTQLAMGIEAANEEMSTAKNGPSVRLVPHVHPVYEAAKQQPDYLGQTKEEHRVQAVTFDVALTSVESGGTKGGGGLKVWGLKAEGGAESAHSSESVSRVRFSVPVGFVAAR